MPLAIIETLSIEQKLSDYDLYRLISQILRKHDRYGLLEAMIRDDPEGGSGCAHNLDVPFQFHPSF